ncbi:MAG: bifunctional [glutamine synthetase] adenylyltransferase/[glutamine synthetase]-adenylyl-L-tyrosine phosphorylase [Streptosporangiales bacterium]|nr:bifunctional [glutamine synthetase] adenylyltransferase/[glutamine synthetase]-adenylyl-L-tyrosine phosphorylase [Streptosporangiales bacterium]
MGEERTTLLGRLARLGFADPEAASELLDGIAAELVGDLADTADPDLALANVCRLRDAIASGADPDAGELAALDDTLRGDDALRHRLLAVLGFSSALGDHLVRHPGQWRALREPVGQRPRADLLAAVGADPVADQPCASTADGNPYDALRVGYRRALLVVAARDLAGELALDQVAALLSDLACAALEAALAIARTELPADAAPCRLAVLGMGKCGGRELNYSSDVDVIFVAEPVPDGDEAVALATATKLAAGMMRACSQNTQEGVLWPVDAALRPEGKAGPLVRTLASHESYLNRWAKTWEFQALLKVRPVAGDLALGEEYVGRVTPLVWHAADRDGFVDEVQGMRRRVEEHVPQRDADRQLKLGRGGLRDVEFAVQLLQLVHGRSDETLHSGNTLAALAALTDGGYVGRDDGPPLADAYCYLRTLEHRLQLRRLRRTHVVPAEDAELRCLGRALGYRTQPISELVEQWQRHAREVRRLHEKLFYRPLLNAVARLPGEQVSLTPEAARRRLEALGYADPAGALRHIESLTAGVSRRAAIQRTLLPVMLGYFADGPDPDYGLLAFRQASDALGRTPWYLRLLREEVAAAERLAKVLAAGRYAADLLLRAPEAVRIVGAEEELVPRPHDALAREAASIVGRQDDPERAVAGLRGVRRRELFRVSAADLLSSLDVEAVGAALTTVTEVTIAAALDVALRTVRAGEPAPGRFAVIGMGRFGGAEMAYGSDADVLFVYEAGTGVADEDAARWAHAVADELRRLLALPCPDPPVTIDADLRPEGRSGPLVRSLASYQAYYQRWSSPWESQALLRARPVAGDRELGERFSASIEPLRYPAQGLGGSALKEIRRLKARMEAERLPRGVDPAMHVKLGPGGLSDVEWVAQLLQLRHAGAQPALRTTGTVTALEQAVVAELLDPADRDELVAAWRFASRVRNARGLVTGKQGDTIPVEFKERGAVARVLGYEPDHVGSLVEDYRRSARHARNVFERVFYES